MGTGHPLTPEQRAMIIRLRRQGLTMRTVADRVGCHLCTVSKTLRRAGIPATRFVPSRLAKPPMVRCVMQLAQQGLTQRQTAQQLGLTYTQVNNVVRHHGLRHEQDHITSRALATEIGLTHWQINRTAAKGLFAHDWWFRGLAFTPEQAQAVRDYYARTCLRADDVTGWLTSTQAARECGMHTRTFLTLLQTDLHFQAVRHGRVLGMAGNVHRYEPHSVLAAARARRASLTNTPHAQANAAD